MKNNYMLGSFDIFNFSDLDLFYIIKIFANNNLTKYIIASNNIFTSWI